MQDQLFRQLLPSLSRARLTAYSLTPLDDRLAILTNYLWNITLCEALYPALNLLEVALRNNLSTAIDHTFSPAWLITRDPQVLLPAESATVLQAQQKLQTEGKNPADVGQLIAALTFGFWSSLCNARYERHLWRPLLKDKSAQRVFPALPRHLRTRKTLSVRLELIRRLRNRIFHHEPIWRNRDLAHQHDQLLETIYWLNPDLRALLPLIDRFPDLYANGHAALRLRLQHFLTTYNPPQ